MKPQRSKNPPSLGGGVSKGIVKDEDKVLSHNSWADEKVD